MTKQTAFTKQHQIYRVPISHEAVVVVLLRREMVPKGCPFLFPGDVPDQPVGDPMRFWLTMQMVAQIPDVRIHDLRQTFAYFGLARKMWRAPTEEPRGVLWETGTDRRRSFGVKRCGWR
ncbi:MAG: hypothetical protein O9321_08425 [Rubrivivax sp.]|nr:hypothetical protein [Rubrivivax sp.]